MTTNNLDRFVSRAMSAGVALEEIGRVGGTNLRIGASIDLDVQEIARRRANALEDSLAGVG